MRKSTYQPRNKNAALFEKIVLYENIWVNLLYSECDILSNLSKHALSFIYDSFYKKEENSILRFNCNKALLNLDSKGYKSTANFTGNLSGNSNDNRKDKEFKEEKKFFENLKEDIYGEYDWENKCNSFKNPKTLAAKGNAGNSYSSKYLMKENNNFNEGDSLNRSLTNNNNIRKNTYVRNKTEISDKSNICLNSAKRFF